MSKSQHKATKKAPYEIEYPSKKQVKPTIKWLRPRKMIAFLGVFQFLLMAVDLTRHLKGDRHVVSVIRR